MKLQAPMIALKVSHKAARWKQRPVLCPAHLAGTCLREAWLWQCEPAWFPSVFVSILVLFAALYEGIIIEMVTAHQSKALSLENLKAQINKPNPERKPQVEAWGEVRLHLVICSPDTSFCSFPVEMQKQIWGELIHWLHFSSHCFQNFPGPFILNFSWVW